MRALTEPIVLLDKMNFCYDMQLKTQGIEHSKKCLKVTKIKI